MIPLHNLRGFTRRHFAGVRNFHGGRRIKTGAGGLNRPTQRAEIGAAARWHHGQTVVIHWADHERADMRTIGEGDAIGLYNQLKTFITRNRQRDILRPAHHLTSA